MNIVIPEDYTSSVATLHCFSMLDGHDVKVYHEPMRTIDEIAEKCKDAEALVLIRERTPITEELLARLPKLKLISQTGKISNHLDLDACTKHKVAVAEGVGSPIAPAELTWTLIMNAARQVPQAIEDMKNGRWQKSIGRGVHGKTIGIWGYGKIGKMIAGYAKAFDMRVMVWGSETSRMKATDDGHIAALSKEQFFSEADIVTLHLRLVTATKGIVKADDLALMKPTSILVNTARAELIEQGALLPALRTGHPGFAALDVYEEEPITDTTYELLNMRNVICTPHLGYVEREGYELYFSKAFENVVAFDKGQPMNIANPEVLG